MKIRRARLEDAPKLVEIRSGLPMPAEATAAQGGFLLGTDETGYRTHIQNDIVWVLEDDGGKVNGLSVVWRNETVRNNEIWQKKDLVEWQSELSWDAYRFCYFDQLAVLPGAPNRHYGKYLALAGMMEAMRDHDFAFATVVAAPVNNLASRPFLRAAGFQLAGQIDESYPTVGRILSDVFFLKAQDFRTQIQSTYAPLAERLQQILA